MKKILVLLALCLSANSFALKVGDLHERINNDSYYPKECVITYTGGWIIPQVEFREWEGNHPEGRYYLLEVHTFEDIYREER